MRIKKIPFLVSCFLVLYLWQYPLACENQIEKAENLEKRLKGASPRQKLDLLLQIMQIQMMIKTRPEKVIGFGKEAIRLAAELKDFSAEGYAKVYQSHALAYAKKKDAALQTMQAAINVFLKIGNKTGIIEAKYRLGLIFRMESDFERALKYYYQALEMSDEIQDTEKSILLNYEIGIINMNLNEHDNAMRFYHQALMQAEKIHSFFYMAMISNNIGGIYRDRKELTIALKYFQQCLDYFQKIGDEHWMAIAHSNIGGVFGDLNQFDQAIGHIKMVLEHARKTKDEVREANNLESLSLLYKKKKEYAKAEEYLSQAIELARKKERKSTLMSCYLSNSRLQEEMGNFQEALKYLRWHMDLNEKVMSDEKSKEISRLQEEFNARNREKEIDLLKKNTQIERMRRNMLIAGILMLIVFLIFIIHRYIYLFAFWKRQKYIGQYRLLEPLGSGGVGNVFKAHLLRNRSAIVAIKLLKEELFVHKDQQKRFRREAEIIDQLNHPNILRILERGEIDNKLYMVMEYIEGITLAEKMARQGALPLEICLHIMRQVTAALTLIHEKNIIHRDLKPANIMLTKRGNDENFVKLLDFGLSRMASHSRVTQTGLLIGTLAYLAPEQIIKGENTFASDVYALGIVFYEMFTGAKTFAGDSFTAITQQILQVDPPSLDNIRSDIPLPMAGLVMKMIAKDPQQRPTVEEIQTKLAHPED